MGYNIEVSFNVYKNCSVTETQDNIKILATNSGCNYFYEDYEFENNIQYQRRHYLITVNFEKNTNINFINDFLRNIKRQKGLYIESIYDDETNVILYASKYYQTQKMLKGNNYKEERKKRSYSEDDMQIINVMKK
jgi:hypothetical protein